MRLFRPLVVFALLTLPSLATAQIIPESGTIGSSCNFKTGDLHFDCIPILIGLIVKFLFAGIGTFALIQIMYGGYEIAIGGAAGTTDKGKARIKHAIIGLIVALLIFGILNFIITSVT